jgi:hypothetical protein
VEPLGVEAEKMLIFLEGFMEFLFFFYINTFLEKFRRRRLAKAKHCAGDSTHAIGVRGGTNSLAIGVPRVLVWVRRILPDNLDIRSHPQMRKINPHSEWTRIPENQATRRALILRQNHQDIPEPDKAGDDITRRRVDTQFIRDNKL